jgi:hypothetical protein
MNSNPGENQELALLTSINPKKPTKGLLLGTDFRHAVEFSRSGRARTPAFSAFVRGGISTVHRAPQQSNLGGLSGGFPGWRPGPFSLGAGRTVHHPRGPSQGGPRWGPRWGPRSPSLLLSPGRRRPVGRLQAVLSGHAGQRRPPRRASRAGPPCLTGRAEGVDGVSRSAAGDDASPLPTPRRIRAPRHGAGGGDRTTWSRRPDGVPNAVVPRALPVTATCCVTAPHRPGPAVRRRRGDGTGR